LSTLAFQGDFGPVVQLYLVSVVMAYLASGSFMLVGVNMSLLVGGGALAYAVGIPSILRTRVDMWANPFDLSEGMTRALWAIASGGFWGTGLGLGRPEMVPVVHSDYILAGIAEELGWLGAASVLALYAVLVLRGAVIAMRQATVGGALLAAGLTTLLAVQVLLVAGGNIGWVPVTGLTLPGLAHGGTSLVATGAVVGVLARMSAATNAGGLAPR
jgi:cell division protein FtsW (lipid II flippase)